MQIQGINIRWLGHSGFNIENKIIIDPYKIAVPIKTNIVLITHPHYDHCSIEDVEKLADENTTIIIPPDCTSKFARQEKGKIKIIETGQSLQIEDIKIEAIPAYNTNKPFHQKENNWCGYIITINNKKIYHAGDTDLIPEMNNLDVDIALLPIGGTYTMNVDEAIEAIKKIKAKTIIPMHYGSIVGSKADAERLKKLLPDKVVIL